MEKNDRRDNWELWGVAAIVSIAVLIGLVIKGFSGETMADAVKDIGAVLVPILAAALAARLVIRQMDPGQRYVQAGEDGLRAIQKKHPRILSGPKPDKEGYDPDNPGKAGRYLFFQKINTLERSQLIPVLPFKVGVIEVRVSKRTLKILEITEELDAVSSRVSEAVKAVLERQLKGTFEILEVKNPNISIVIDFDEEKLGPRGFRKAVEQCTEAALKVLVKRG